MENLSFLKATKLAFITKKSERDRYQKSKMIKNKVRNRMKKKTSEIMKKKKTNDSPFASKMHLAKSDPSGPSKEFDLNIEKILENWDVCHAVREIIANGLDEQLITKTKDVEIYKQGKVWNIRDHGRGLKYAHLTQKENPEKLLNSKSIGKFGIGLKDSLATFDRKGIKVIIRSKHGDITLRKSAKQGFSDIKTLHASISSPMDATFLGTKFTFEGIADKDIEKAKNLFLKFTSADVIESTKFGDVVSKVGDAGKIYINGVQVAEEANFLFSYNITSLTASIKKALNRERTNVGRAAYAESVKKILLSCKATEVAKELVNDLKDFQNGNYHDELSWLDVQEHAVKILNQKEKVLFVSASDHATYGSMIDNATRDGHQVITIPENLKDKIRGALDLSGNPIVEISQFVRSYNDSFEYKFIDADKLTTREKAIYNYTEDILDLIGGKPYPVRHIKISTTMRINLDTPDDTKGVWNPSIASIIILRQQLRSLQDYAATLIHEALHAKSGERDVSRAFEIALTDAIGLTSFEALKGKKASGKLK